jgi:putative PEP-CTERM system histidine kinase
VWAAALALRATGPLVPAALVFVLEVIRDGAWLLVALRLWGAVRRDVPRWAYALAIGTATLVLFGGIAIGTLRELGYTWQSPGRVLIPGALALSLIGLFLSEQIYRTAEPAERWRLKFVCFGLSGLFLFELILYSVALIFNAIESSLLLARGAVNAMLVPLFALGIARSTAGPRLFVSSRLVIYGASLVAAGAYLMAIAFAGYYIRIFGGSWGAAMQVVFVFATALLLAALIFSGQVRAWLRVSLSKHLLPYKYDYRSESLRLIHTITSPAAAGTLAKRALTAVAQIVQSDAGGIWVRREAAFVPAGGDFAGPDSPALAVSDPLAAFLESRGWIFDLTRASGEDPRLEGIAVPRWLADLPKAWLVVPILHETRLVAFMVLKAPLATHSLTWEDLDLLRTAGRQVGSYIALEEAANALAQSRQFEAYNRFVAFLMHDLNNLMAQLTLVVQNAARFRGKPEFFDDAIATIDHSVKRLTRLLEQLKQGEAGSAVRRLKLVDACREAVARCTERAPRPELLATEPSAEVLASPERLVAVLENVIRNAQEATPADGRVTVEVRQDTTHAIVRISDTGTGMDAAFVRDRLFRPFDTTKGSHGMGIGAYQAREFARMAGGDVAVESRPGSGTLFTILLPMNLAT